MIKLFKKEEKKVDLQEWYGVNLDYRRVKDQIAPAIVEEKSDYMRLGENYARTLVVIDYPSNKKGNWLSKLYRFKGNLTVSYHFSPKSAEKLKNKISKSIDELEVRLEGKLTARRKEQTRNELDSADKVLKKLMSGDNNQIFNLHMYLHLQAESLEELDRLTKRLKNLVWKLGLKMSIPTDRMMKGFQSVLPTNNNELPEFTYRNMDAEAASSIFPYDESEIFHEKGVIRGKNIKTGNLVVVDPAILKNQNEFVLGTSGSGKTFGMFVNMIRNHQDGVRIFAIDPEREYAPKFRRMGGQVVTISSMSGSIINPLEIMIGMDLVEDIEEKNGEEKVFLSKSYLHQKISRLKVFFKLIKRDLTHLEAALIEDVLINTYKRFDIDWETDFSKFTAKDFPILADLYDELEAVNDPRLADFGAILKTYVSGSNSLMFNGHTNVNLYSKAVCFDLKDLEDDSDVQPAAMYNVLSFLWDEITRDNKERKRLYIDEAHIMADPDNPKAMRFVFNIYKRIRKYNGGVTAATQQIADFLSAVENKRNYGKAVIGNSQTKMILSLEPSDIEDIKNAGAIQLSEEETRILSTEKRGEGIFIVGKKRVHMQVDYTPVELELIDPIQYKAKFGKGITA